MSSPRDNDFDADDENILAWESRLSSLDYYELLGVTADTPLEELTAAYDRFALAFHPDTRPQCSPEIRRALTRVFQRGVEARQVLSDGHRKALYELARLRGERRLQPETSAPPVDLESALADLHVHCRSAGAKLDAQQAARAWARGDLEQVQRRLLSALRFDGNANLDVERCLQSLSAGRVSTYPSGG